MQEKSHQLSNKRIIQVNTKEEITHWCHQFNCSEKDLLDAIVKVGRSFNSVDAYLEMNDKKNNWSK